MMFIFAYIILEILFYIYIKYKRRLLNTTYNAQYKYNSSAIYEVIDILKNMKSYNAQMFLQECFLGSNIKDIYDGNIKSFISWACYGKPFSQQLTSIEYNTIYDLYNNFCEIFQISFKEGYNNDVKHIAMNLSNIKYVHHPLFLYAIFKFLHMLLNMMLRCMGFEKRYINDYSYVIREHKSSLYSPMIFLRDINPFYLAYLNFISYFKNHTIILFDIDLVIDPVRISSLDFNYFDISCVVDTIGTLVDIYSHNNKCHLIGHSFGTVVATWFIKQYPQKIRTISLIDPVCILLGLPDVAKNFFYRSPTTTFHKIIRFFASRELPIANTLFRNFKWQEYMLFL